MYGHVTDTDDRWIARWLTLCAVVIFGMILLGGVTRSDGLGAVDGRVEPDYGQPFPPLSEPRTGSTAFEKYKQLYPEYQKINYGMSIERVSR